MKSTHDPMADHYARLLGEIVLADDLAAVLTRLYAHDVVDDARIEAVLARYREARR